MQRVLVLNASYEPLQLVPARRALVLLLQEKAEVVEAAQRFMCGITRRYAIPLVIRLTRYIRIPRNLKLPCTRHGVIMRDKETCQYCGVATTRAQLTIDHVVPRAHGGTTEWHNVVAACRSCNHRKGGRTPTEASMPLLSVPRQPTYIAFALLNELERDAVWRKYSFV
jgi:5-methylcytosine-specific restriction endonuclease McrA